MRIVHRREAARARAAAHISVEVLLKGRRDLQRDCDLVERCRRLWCANHAPPTNR